MWGLLVNTIGIIDIIEANPGIKFSEIMRETGLKNGVLSYQLRKLEDSGSVKTERTLGTTRYYPLGMNDEESSIIKHLRQKRFHIVMVLLYENPRLSFQNIVAMSKLSSSSVSIVLSKLVSEGIVNVAFVKRKKFYDIDKKNIIKNMIEIYHNSILNNTVSRHSSTIVSLLIVAIGLSEKFLFDLPVDYAILDRLSLF